MVAKKQIRKMRDKKEMDRMRDIVTKFFEEEEEKERKKMRGILPLFVLWLLLFSSFLVLVLAWIRQRRESNEVSNSLDFFHFFMF